MRTLILCAGLVFVLPVLAQSSERATLTEKSWIYMGVLASGGDDDAGPHIVSHGLKPKSVGPLIAYIKAAQHRQENAGTLFFADACGEKRAFYTENKEAFAEAAARLVKAENDIMEEAVRNLDTVLDDEDMEAFNAYVGHANEPTIVRTDHVANIRSPEYSVEKALKINCDSPTIEESAR
jgi:hypothetical protein